MLLDQRIAEAAVRAASAHETPLFLTDAAALETNADAVASAFPDPWLRAYSLKADPEPSLVRRLAARGWAANCVSLGEIAAARDAGVPASQTTLEGIGKSGAELDAAIAASLAGTQLRWIAVESLDEARDLGDRATAAGLTAQRPLRVLLRLNPGIEPGTHAGLAVGRASSKFGMDRIELAAAAKALSAAPGLRIIGTAPHKAAVISFVVDGIHPHDLGTILDQEGVAVRTGHHCAMPVMEFFDVPATARASFAFYNTPAEIDQLVGALHHARELFC
jgi:diaminopimelate decarboxylase